jgi:hypothetical protein
MEQTISVVLNPVLVCMILYWFFIVLHSGNNAVPYRRIIRLTVYIISAEIAMAILGRTISLIFAGLWFINLIIMLLRMRGAER